MYHLKITVAKFVFFDAAEAGLFVIADCLCWPGNHPFLAVVDTQIDHPKLLIHDRHFLCFVPSVEPYVVGNGYSNRLGMKS